MRIINLVENEPGESGCETAHGLLPEGFTRQCVANNIHYPFIATALEILNTTENRYSGIPTIYVEMKKAGLFEPKFENIICEKLHNSAY